MQAFVGANSYVGLKRVITIRFTEKIPLQWLPLLLSQNDVEKTFDTMEQAGVKVLRTWVRSFVSDTSG